MRVWSIKTENHRHELNGKYLELVRPATWETCFGELLCWSLACWTYPVCILTPLITYLILTWESSMDSVLLGQSIKASYPSLPKRKACDLNSAKSLHWVRILNTYIETEDCEIFLGVVSRSDCHLTPRPRNHSALRPLSEILPTTPRCSKKFYFLILVGAEFLCSQLWKPHHGIITMGFYPKTLIIYWNPKYRHYT